MFLTVILCTHNPRIEVLRQTLDGLKQQSLDAAQWELLLVDNASDVAITENLLGDYSPQIRVIREPRLGLTPARLCGIRQAEGELLVFVDDDNVLDPDYLKNALEISRNHPKLGAFGGSIKAVFEEEAPAWTQPYWYLLAVRDTPEDRISMAPGNAAAEPCGAGLCVRKEVAQQYARYIENDPIRRALDRSGSSLASSGDMDLVYTAFDLGYGIGRFRSLVLHHLIPPTRLTEAYFLRIFEAMYYSGTMLKKIRGTRDEENQFSVIQTLRRWKHFVFGHSLDRRMMLAERRGRRRALIDWRNMHYHEDLI